MLFSFVKKRFWWPRRRKFYINRFFFFLLKKKRKRRPYYSFRNSRTLTHLNKNRFVALFSRKWLLSKIVKYVQRRLTSFRFLKQKINFPKFFFKRRKKFVKVTLRFTVNNVFLTISDSANRVLTYFSSGSVGFSGPTRTTSFASEQIVAKACKFLKKRRFSFVHLIVLSGMFNYKSKAVLDSLVSHKIRVKAVTYKINVPHNGVRPRKAKRR